MYSEEEAKEEISEEEAARVVEGAILKRTSTKPSFSIWLFPPKKDIISRKIKRQGFYEAEEMEFTDLVVAAIQQSTTQQRNAWAVDIGANIGFHTLHMAANGMNVVAFEPAIDTASLLQKSIEANAFDGQFRPKVHLVRAAAGESNGMGRLVRHPKSPGMTMLLPYNDNNNRDREPLPFGVEAVVGDNIKIVRPEEVLEGILQTTTSSSQNNDSSIENNKRKLALLKVDAEGHELHALQGTNLVRFPFDFLAFEFFPELLQKAGGTDPLDLLLYVVSFGYDCATHPSSLLPKVLPEHMNTTATNNQKNNNTNQGILMETEDNFRDWYEGHAVPSYKKNVGYHQNLYCRRR